MATDRGNDLLAFRSFLDDHVLQGESVLTLDEALGLWEYENSSEQEREETLAAIREGLDDTNAGRTRPARDVLAQLRQKYDAPQ